MWAWARCWRRWRSRARRGGDLVRAHAAGRHAARPCRAAARSAAPDPDDRREPLTVQVSFCEHALVPEPFLIVGLIAAIRRLLVLTAEFAPLLQKNDGAFHGAMLELGLLTVMIVAFVFALVVLKKHAVHGVSNHAPG